MDLNVAITEVGLRINVNTIYILVHSKETRAVCLTVVIREHQIDKYKTFINFVV
jgi:hypothetical protein